MPNSLSVPLNNPTLTKTNACHPYHCDRIKKTADFLNNVASENGGAISSPADATFDLPDNVVFDGNYVRYVSQSSSLLASGNF